MCIRDRKSGEETVYESCQVGFRKLTYKTNASGWFEGSTGDADLIRINGQPISPVSYTHLSRQPGMLRSAASTSPSSMR